MSGLNLSKISPYTRRILIQHVGYVIIMAAFLLLGGAFIPYQVKEYFALRNQLQKTTTDIKQFEARLAAIEEYPTADLEDTVYSMNSIYPSEEDRFSIFGALDNLQKVTGMDIESYSSPFSGKSFRDISINVKASADLPKFRRFLRDHVYKSGRFMTISKVAYSNENQTLNFTATFHSKHIDIKTSKPVEIKPELIQQALQIKREVETAGLIQKTSTDEVNQLPEDYSTKQNPFQ